MSVRKSPTPTGSVAALRPNYHLPSCGVSRRFAPLAVTIAFVFPDALFSDTMITAEAVTTYIRQIFPDAAVTVIDKTGTQDHLIVRVTSAGFAEKNLLDRHRMVYHALAAPMKDGRIHALEITATTPDEVNK